MRLSYIRPILAIAFVGAVGSAAAKEYVGVSKIVLPEGCSGPVACGSVCSARPESCVAYCTADAAHAVECSQWAQAYKSSGTVAIAQSGEMSSMQPGSTESMMPPNGLVPMHQEGSPGMMPPKVIDPNQAPPSSGFNMPPGEGGQQMQGPMSSRPCPMMPEMACGEDQTRCEFGTPDGCRMAKCAPAGSTCDQMMGPPQGEGEFRGAPSKPTGVPLGGGLHGAGPMGCKGPEECKSVCEKPENKVKCEQFFQGFRFAPRGFEDQGERNPEDFERERKDAQEQMLRRMKQEMKHMSRMIEQMKKRMRDMERRKVAIPEEVKAALAKIEELRAKMEAVTEPEELGELGPEMAEQVQFVNEKFGDLERLAHAPRMVAQAGKMLKQFEAQIRRNEARAKARKVDVTEQLQEAKTLLEEMKAALESAKAAIAQGDAEEAFAQLEEGVFQRFEEAQEKMIALEMVVRAPQIITQKKRELRGIEARIRARERKREDMTEAKSLLNEAKAKFEECQQLVRVRPLPVEELIACTEEFEDILDQVRSALGEEEFPEGKFQPFELELPSGVPIAPSTSFGPPSGSMMGPPPGFEGGEMMSPPVQ